MADIVPDPNTVVQWYGPGVWLDTDDQLHIDPSPILRHIGWPDTEENRNAVIEEAKEIFRKAMPEATIVDFFDK